ncbi:MAG: ATP-binding protein [Vicinamibacterales bacterium]
MTRSFLLARSIARIVAAGLLVAAMLGLGGLAFERGRFGASDDATVARVQDELEERFSQTASALTSRAARVRAAASLIREAPRDTAAARSLFETLASAVPGEAAGIAGITVFGARANPIAWAGRVSDVPRERIDGPAGLFVTLDALGPHLLHVESVPDPERASGPRLGTIVAEQLAVQRPDTSPSLSDTFRLPTALVDVTIRPPRASPRSDNPYVFPVRVDDGPTLVEAEVDPADLAALRQAWHARIRASVLTALGLTVLLCAAPVLERRRQVRQPGAFAAWTVTVVALLVAGRLLLREAAGPFITPDSAGLLELFPDALFLAALVSLTLDTAERRRLASPRPPLLRDRPASVVLTATGGLAAGAVGAGMLWAYEDVLSRIAGTASQDLLRFSLHPFDVHRLGATAAVVLLSAAVVWAAAAAIRLPAILWRTPRRTRFRTASVASAFVGMASIAALAQSVDPAVPAAPLVLALLASSLAAWALSRPRRDSRRASQAARLGLRFVGIALPAVLLYPSLDAYAVASKERLISETFAPAVANQREDLQSRQLPLALDAIDRAPSLAGFVSGSSEEAAPTTDRAFIVWSQTLLSTARTTSAVELYGPNGGLVSRFAFNFPEYGAAEYRGGSCSDWELYEEVSPFGSSLRNVLRASRAICRDGRRVGGIVVRARLDYRALPFISTQSPYLAWLTPQQRAQPELAFGSDVELVFYGWSRAPLFASGTAVWPLDDGIFAHMVASREPMWASINRDGRAFRVYFFNDRGGIYALGYPVITRFDHLVNLGELVFLTGVLYVCLLIAGAFVNVAGSRTSASGRELLREIRSSFYRKLFIAFVAAAVLPVVVLAFATRTYFANQFRTGVEESAVKTATVAQRLVEDYVALQQRGAGSLDRVDDEFMLLVRRAIDEDVNLFDGPRLQATSERPLFASRLLPARTPADVYRAIVLDRLPAAVVVEEVGGTAGYLVAAAPVRAGGREGIVTVPQTLRQREIEAQIDEIDRRVLSAAVLFVLLGSALGYWMAERIADPVNRLTRATRRIARGDFDARVAATSSDELRRLVQDFNQMAHDLQQQRAELERTQRLEAWAEMARQVAHDIKNPLTPIQLSAEHARRVNIDRGRPLSPVLDECVAAILSQVKLLRQISSEFSSFASSPTPRIEPTDVGLLIEEVVEPYRAGLAARVAIVVTVDPDLPPAAIDRTLFSRALTNVIENALHAMPGSGTLRVEARAEHGGADGLFGERIVVQVADTGVGMDAEALARIFEPYFSTKATGTGLGLTIAKRNVELSGGIVEVQSERGVGTTVTMRLPIHADGNGRPI